jgi:hypothetical protein
VFFRVVWNIHGIDGRQGEFYVINSYAENGPSEPDGVLMRMR